MSHGVSANFFFIIFHIYLFQVECNYDVYSVVLMILKREMSKFKSLSKIAMYCHKHRYSLIHHTKYTTIYELTVIYFSYSL